MPQALVSQHPAILHKLTRLRDQDTPPREFRDLVRALAALLGVEATANLPTQPHEVQTPLRRCAGVQLQSTIALVPILRAGLGMTDGLLELFPQAAVRHLGFYRNEQTLEPVAYYNKLPDAPAEDLCLVLDPMLATGGSACAAVSALKSWGARRIKFLGILGAPEGVARLQAEHPEVAIHLCGLDECLDERGYIVPGLGDAGDRLYHT